MRKLLFGALILLGTKSEAQAPPVNLPEFLPPSPDVAAIMKGAELSSSMHTGAANAAIPIYDIKVKGFTLPVSLNYSSNGFKPNEAVSRVGSGWSLSAGGVVSRIQRGKPDDYCTTPTPKTISELLQYDAAALSYIMDIESPVTYHDAQPDEYRYSVNGLSGKFIIQRNGTVLPIPYNNVKINVVKSSGFVIEIHITDTKGVKYIFGYEGKIEKTLTHNLFNNYLDKDELNTAWMLTKIELPAGEYINFTYSSIDHVVNTGKSTSVQKGYGQSSLCGGSEPQCITGLELTEKVNTVEYRSYYVTAISVSTGLSVLFTYEDRPDNGGDNRLSAIGVYKDGTMIKKMELEFANAHNSTPSGQTNAVFFLKKFKIKDPTLGSAPTQEYTLKYVHNEFEFETPGGEDHLGFATDGTSSTPQPELTETEEIFSGYIVSKNPDGEVAKIGMLQKIIYPTGGYDEFHYEPNMKSTWGDVPNVKIVAATIQEDGSSGGNQTFTKNFTIGKTQVAEFHLVSNWMTTPPIPDGTEFTPAPKSAVARVIDNSDNSTVVLRNYYGFAEGEYESIDGPASFQIQPGSYTLEVVTKYSSDDYRVRADIVFDSAVTSTWTNIKEELCGVRVRKIVNYDPVSDKSVSRFYKYEKLGDSTQISAVKQYFPQYISENSRAVLCPGQSFQKLCYSKVFSSNSVSTTYINDAAGVTYRWVIESDDSLFANGGIEHSFFNEGTVIGQSVIGENIPNPPTDPYNYRNGLDTLQVYFNSNGDVVKRVRHYYSFDTSISIIQNHNYIIRKRYTPIITYSPITQQNFEEYDVIEYPVYTAWNHLDSTITKEYDLVNSSVMVSKVSYHYGNPVNIQPVAMTTMGSDYLELRTEYKYPTDFPGDAVCSTMTARNILEPVVTEESYKDSWLLYKTETQYKDWFSDGKILLPELVKKQKGTNDLETRIRYYQYNTSGTPLELSKENDVRVSYIWDYNGQLPIAEVINGSYGSGVAYTSFEADGKGGWTFSGSPSTEGTEPGGSKSYSLASGDITYPSGLMGGGRYTVSYWAKAGSSITVNGGTATQMLSKSGWLLYRKEITYSGSSGITISGSGVIDELRLHPALALIKTFTYKPEVGITTAGDNNNLLQRYEYDEFNRLLRVRDMDNNILKQYEYKYGQTITPCPNTSANWVATGEYRCVKTNAWSNNNTGVREQEEVDKNNCSTTYMQKRWVSLGSSGLCPVVSNCTGYDKRVVNGVCETGCKVFVRSVYNGYLNWTCYYRYEWTDGFKGPEIAESSSYTCVPGVCF